jgi:hypothetical protein
MRAGRWPAGRPDGLLTLFLDGWRRVASAPVVLAAVWALSVLKAPGSYFLVLLGGLGDLATGRVIVDAATMMVMAPIVGLAVAAWTFLWGGIVDRYARPDKAPARDFFAACWTHSGRMLRLGLVAGIAYLLALHYVEPAFIGWIAPWVSSLAEHVEVMKPTERLWVIFLWNLPTYAVYVLTDLTRVRLVIEDRRSVLFAFLAGWRSLAARPLAVLGIYLVCGLAFAAWFEGVSLLMRAAGPDDVAVWAPWVEGVLLSSGRALVDVMILATLVALYQADTARPSLAHHPAVTSGLTDLNALTAKE